MKGALLVVANVAVIVGFVLLWNGWSWLAEGDPRVPRLEGRWWAGYMDTSLFGRVWSTARFFRTGSGDLEMALLSTFGPPQFYKVERTSSNHMFVQLTFTDEKARPPMRIEAKQAYEGKRYFWGRLFNGRFTDFWKMNEEVQILGSVVSWNPPLEFAIEPMSDDRLMPFWTKLVRPSQPSPGPADILTSTGRRLSAD